MPLRFHKNLFIFLAVFFISAGVLFLAVADSQAMLCPSGWVQDANGQCYPSSEGTGVTSGGLPGAGNTTNEGLPATGNTTNEGLPVTQNTTEGAPVSYGPSGVSLPNFIGVKSVSDLMVKIAKFLMPLAISFAVLMLIWSGFLFATAQGVEEKIIKARRNFLWTVAGVAVILASQAIIDYISEILGGKSTGQGAVLLDKVKGLLNQVIVLLFILVTIYFGWGILQYVRSAGDEKAIAQGKKHMIWGIVGMTVMAGAWGIVRIILAFVQ